MKDPKAVATKWNRNIKGSTESIKEGVARVEVAPSELAIKAKEKFKQRLIEAIDNGDWEAGLANVSKEDWQRAMEKGIQRIPQGADMAVSDVEDFMADFLPHVEAGKQKVAKMPNVTLEDNINRMVEMVRHNAQYKRKK